MENIADTILCQRSLLDNFSHLKAKRFFVYLVLSLNRFDISTLDYIPESAHMQ